MNFANSGQNPASSELSYVVEGNLFGWHDETVPCARAVTSLVDALAGCGIVSSSVNEKFFETSRHVNCDQIISTHIVKVEVSRKSPVMRSKKALCMAGASNKPPDKFLTPIHRIDDGDLIGMSTCAGFELGEWRSKKLAEHLVNWLPHFALRPSELESIGHQNHFKLLKEAAYRVFKKDASQGRGEIGELLLHIIGVTEYRAHAFVSRLFYKMRTNDQVTGFDSALVTYDADTDEVELWLGEAKSYKDVKSGVSAALSSLKTHLDAGFLEETKILVGPKIEPSSPGYEKLQWLFDDGNTLDEIVERIVVPVLIASESEAAKEYNGCEETYKGLVIEEYDYITQRISKSPLSDKVRIVALYVPLASKESLEAEFSKKIGAYE